VILHYTFTEHARIFRGVFYLSNHLNCLPTFSTLAIVAKNLDICPNLSFNLRLLTNELGGRLHYEQPFCVFHA
jgi:hypothetical protein